MVPAFSTCTINGVEYSAKGKTAHASKPDLGVNAVFEMIKKLDEQSADYSASPLLTYISKELVPFTSAEYTGCNVTDESGSVTANPSILNCGDDGESLTIDIRCPVSYSMDAITSFMAMKAAQYDLDCEILSQMAPLYKAKDLPEISVLTDIWKDNMSSYTGYKPEYLNEFTEPIAIGGGTYARHMPNTIAFGIQTPWQEDQCHQTNECMPLQDFETDIKVLTEAIKGLAES